MQIVVNGKEHSIPDGASVLALVRSLGIESRRIAVEVNGRIVPSRDQGAVLLNDRDRVEIVQFVGGG